MLPPNWCLFFLRDPVKAFTTERLRECLRPEGLTVTGDAEPLAVRYAKRPGPTLFVSVGRGPHLETIVRSLVGPRPEAPEADPRHRHRGEGRVPLVSARHDGIAYDPLPDVDAAVARDAVVGPSG